MSKVLTVSDELYAQLETAARQRGLSKVEELLEAWQANEEEQSQRARTVERIDALRTRLYATYGEMPDSVELIGQDRTR
jgi:5'-deoxynucleotidase YfbR-like HD superfamily hydrolase